LQLGLENNRNFDCKTQLETAVKNRTGLVDFGGIARQFGGIARTQHWLQICTAHENPISAELNIVGNFYVFGRNFRIRPFLC